MGVIIGAIARTPVDVALLSLYSVQKRNGGCQRLKGLHEQG